MQCVEFINDCLRVSDLLDDDDIIELDGKNGVVPSGLERIEASPLIERRARQSLMLMMSWQWRLLTMSWQLM